MEDDWHKTETDEIFFHAELAARANEPLSEELCVRIQPLTMERLRNYMRSHPHYKSLDALLNQVLMEFLYDEGE